MDAEVASLADTAATVLVGAMTTDGWQRVKEGIVTLWWHSRPGRAETVAEELEESRSAVMTPLEGNESAGQVAQELIGEWRSRLARLLKSDPSFAEELRELLTSWAAQDITARPLGDSVRTDATATGHSRANIAARDIHINESAC